MNVTEYIASGILESYALGTVNEQERREVVCLSSIYPEIAQELAQFTASLEDYAGLHSQQPPTPLKSRIMAQLDFADADADTDDNDTKPALPLVSQPETVVRPLNSLASESASPTYKFSWLVAASVGLVMLIFSGYLFTQLSQTRQTADALNDSNMALTDALKQTRNRQTSDEQAIALLTASGTRTVKVLGNAQAPNGELAVYWNSAEQKVAVSVRSLPTLPNDKQYQLWALVDGKPVDAGVFDVTTGVQSLNRAVARAQAFAVTVEPRGGSVVPTMSTLLAVGAAG